MAWQLAQRFAGGGEGQDFSAASQWYLKAAEQGHLEAQLALARMYGQGEGVETDAEVAVRWYEAAAEQGDAAAKRALIPIYQEGTGIRADPRKSGKILIELVESEGRAEDQLALGLRYYQANGVPSNRGRGAKLLEKAVEEGLKAIPR